MKTFAELGIKNSVMTKPKKTEYIHLRCTPKQKNLIKMKAWLYDETVSEWVLGQLLGDAHTNHVPAVKRRKIKKP
jgi:uncharacterized protein (DUF1778 family)